MTAKNLSTVTTELIASYGNTAKNVINAYRVGTDRAIGFMDKRWDSALRKSADKLQSEVRGNARSAQQKLSAYTTQGIALTTGGADALVSKIVELADKGVHRAAANADQFHQRTGVSTLNTLASVAVPAALAIHKLVEKMEHQSSRLANKLAGKDASVKFAAVKRVTPFGKARSRKAA